MRHARHVRPSDRRLALGGAGFLPSLKNALGNRVASGRQAGYKQMCGSSGPVLPHATAVAAAHGLRACLHPCRDSIKRYSYLQLHKQRRTAAAAREAREAELISTWPHGLPVRLMEEGAPGGVDAEAPPSSSAAAEYSACCRWRCHSRLLPSLVR